MAKLKQSVRNSNHENESAEIHQGISCLPRIDAIDVTHYHISILYTETGMVNNVIDQLFKDIDFALEKVDDEIDISLKNVVKNEI